jgi:hypothetical protein
VEATCARKAVHNTDRTFFLFFFAAAAACAIPTVSAKAGETADGIKERFRVLRYLMAQKRYVQP